LKRNLHPLNRFALKVARKRDRLPVATERKSPGAAPMGKTSEWAKGRSNLHLLCMQIN